MSFELTENDRHSPTWVRLERHLQEELAAMREGNDKPVDEATTTFNRGRISMVKKILALGQKPKTV